MLQQITTKLVILANSETLHAAADRRHREERVTTVHHRWVGPPHSSHHRRQPPDACLRAEVLIGAIMVAKLGNEGNGGAIRPHPGLRGRALGPSCQRPIVEGVFGLLFGREFSPQKPKPNQRGGLPTWCFRNSYFF